jgi:magnesium-transporting ATPase (P-type)
MYIKIYTGMEEKNMSYQKKFKEKIQMKNYRMNAVMAGVLYFLGSAFGVASAVVGGEAISSVVTNNPLSGSDLLNIVAANSSRITGGSFLILMMGISLAAMTVFLYPIFRKDSKELATGMLLFRGAIEGAYYIITTLGFLTLVLLGKEYASTGSDSTALQAIGNVLYQFQTLLGSVGTIIFLIGATCIYISFYRTKLIPRWLSVWGLIGVVPYMAYALLNLFHIESSVGFYLQMVLAPQEMVMALWLIVKGFDHAAINKLMTD